MVWGGRGGVLEGVRRDPGRRRTKRRPGLTKGAWGWPQEGWLDLSSRTNAFHLMRAATLWGGYSTRWLRCARSTRQSRAGLTKRFLTRRSPPEGRGGQKETGVCRQTPPDGSAQRTAAPRAFGGGQQAIVDDWAKLSLLPKDPTLINIVVVARGERAMRPCWAVAEPVPFGLEPFGLSLPGRECEEVRVPGESPAADVQVCAPGLAACTGRLFGRQRADDRGGGHRRGRNWRGFASC